MRDAKPYLDKANLTRSILTLAELEFIGQAMIDVRAVPGDVIELGSYMGGTAIYLADIAADMRVDKSVYGCDTFDGFPVDDTHGAYQRGQFKCWENPDVFAALEKLSAAKPKLRFLKGSFVDTLPTIVDRMFSLVFFDCDIYPSLVTGFEFVKARLNPGARLLFHDYGYEECPGVEPFVETFIRPQFKFVGQSGTNLLMFEK